jgi:hypothetical protein
MIARVSRITGTAVYPAARILARPGVYRVARVTGKLSRAMRAACPRWLLPILAVAIAIPGPQDEAFVAVVVLVMFAIQPVRVRRAASAWRGGKVHRAHDVRVIALRALTDDILTRAMGHAVNSEGIA